MEKEPIESPEKMDTLVNSFVEKVGRRCNICNRTYSRISDLKVHIKTVHLKLNRYKCKICGYASYFRKSLINHLRTHNKKSPLEIGEDLSSELVHDSQTNLSNMVEERVNKFELFKFNKSQCHICKQVFCGKYAANKHIKSVHLKAKPHKCGLCSYATYNKTDLTKHMIVHDSSGNTNRILRNTSRVDYLSQVDNNLDNSSAFKRVNWILWVFKLVRIVKLMKGSFLNLD